MLSLGPLAIAGERLVALLAIWGFLAGTSAIGRRWALPNPARIGWLAVAAGLIVARAAFVAAHARLYADDPLSALAIWQGGFLPWAGIAAAALVIVAALRPWAALLIGIALLGLCAASALAVQAWLRPAPFALPREIMLRSISGSTVRLDDYRGRPLVLNLWATWCGPCRRELPMLVRAAAGSDVPIRLVDAGESATTVQTFLRREGLGDEAVLLDEAQALLRASDSGVLPTTLFIDASGRVRRIEQGQISRAALADGIALIEE
ncbi:MAG: TlpA family protein disulfide reductase [Pseudomonadota bacterium]|uniref:TlpA family protein disulfide reductase n=1 Tax=Rhizorhabdus phycosphaerae TaxID=2711156 RepID=UPI0013EC896C|nr:TlpA disulfide reductase family protein [Rhizorhabdus phycosphaerae]